MDSPAPRIEPRADLRPSAPAASYAQVGQRPPQAEAEAPQEQHRRSGFLNRLAGHVKPAAFHHAPAAQPAHRPTSDDQPAERPQPVTQPTRISPSDRLPSSRSDEDMLEIPAFLRRQAN
jgi:cell division protein FtsZ